MAVTKTLVGSDFHIPFHNYVWVALFISVIRVLRPNRIILNGDMADIYNPSAYPSAEIVTDSVGVEDEIDALRRFLSDVRDAAGNDCEIIYLLGNHEARFDKYVKDNAPIMSNLLALRNYVVEGEFVDKVLPYRALYQLEQTQLYATHSPHSYAIYAAATSMKENVGKSFLTGCTHRPDGAYKKRWNIDHHEVDTYNITGSLADKYKTPVHKAVFSYEKTDRSWPSLIMVNILDGEHFWVENSLIKNNMITIDGKTIGTEDEWS